MFHRVQILTYMMTIMVKAHFSVHTSALPDELVLDRGRDDGTCRRIVAREADGYVIDASAFETPARRSISPTIVISRK
jgi:hypothetical protein